MRAGSLPWCAATGSRACARTIHVVRPARQLACLPVCVQYEARSSAGRYVLGSDHRRVTRRAPETPGRSGALDVETYASVAYLVDTSRNRKGPLMLRFRSSGAISLLWAILGLNQ